MWKKLILFALVFSMLLVPIPEVHAEGDDSAFVSALQTYLGRTPTDADKFRYNLIITSLSADGFSDVQIAGCIGNFDHEGSMPYSIEGIYGSHSSDSGTKLMDFAVGKSYSFTNQYKVGDSLSSKDSKGLPRITQTKSGLIAGCGHGTVQWSFGRADALNDFALTGSSKYGFGYVTITHKYICTYKDGYKTWAQHTCHIPDMAGQVMFMIQEFHGSESNAKKEILSATTPEDAAKKCKESYERGGTNLEARQNSAKAVLPVVQACVGGSFQYPSPDYPTDPDNPDDPNNPYKNIANFTVQKGYWNEDQLSNFCKLNELNLTFADIQSFSYSEREALDNWAHLVNEDLSENLLVSFLRTAVMLFGIALTIWAIVFMLAYMFDSTNNILDFSILRIVSFGRFVKTPDGETDWGFGKLTKKDKGTPYKINTYSMIKIFIITILFSGAILSGLLFGCIQKVVLFMLDIVGRFL